MVQVTPFLLVLSLALVAPSFSASKCKLTGTWVNDLGSNMTINDVNEHGDFDGTYFTAVKDTKNKVINSTLLGSLHPKQINMTFGFTVNWNFSDSITVFTGQCFMDKGGKEILKTMWLLRSHEKNITDDWKAIRVGANTFTRQHLPEE